MLSFKINDKFMGFVKIKTSDVEKLKVDFPDIRNLESFQIGDYTFFACIKTTPAIFKKYFDFLSNCSYVSFLKECEYLPEIIKNR